MDINQQGDIPSFMLPTKSFSNHGLVSPIKKSKKVRSFKLPYITPLSGDIITVTGSTE